MNFISVNFINFGCQNRSFIWKIIYNQIESIHIYLNKLKYYTCVDSNVRVNVNIITL